MLKGKGSDGGGEGVELAADGGFVDIVGDPHAQTGDQAVIIAAINPQMRLGVRKAQYIGRGRCNPLNGCDRGMHS